MRQLAREPQRLTAALWASIVLTLPYFTAKRHRHDRTRERSVAPCYGAWTELKWSRTVKLALIRIQNFRAIECLELRPHPQLTVLHGDNAHGKTSVLSAIAAGLGAIPTALPGVTGLGLKKADRRDGSEYTRVFLKTTNEVAWEQRLGRRLDWHQEPNREHVSHTRPLRDLKDWLNRTALAAWGQPTDLPIVAYYDTDRAVVEAIRRGPKRKASTSRYLALAGALAAKTSFRELFEWFYEKENEELREQRERRNLDYRLKDLSAVRDAITYMVDSVSEPHVEMRPMRFVVSQKLGGRTEKRSLGELSGGCRAVLALAGDLARRMAQGNPHLADPLHSEAVVLIDEVDLHLHPSWQQRILRDLTRTFPNAQFIVSTHSPQVLTTVMPEQIVELHREDGAVLASRAAATTYGAEAGEVLVAVMGVKARPANDFTDKLQKYLRLVGRGKGTSKTATELRDELEELSPQDPALDRADMEMARQVAVSDANS